MDTVLATLRKVFGFSDLRGLQRPVIEHVLSGGDGLVVMPTGGGKSLCYQLPSVILPGVGIVVSPLIALMQNQVSMLKQMGVAAAALHSALEPETQRDVTQALSQGRLDLLYVSPERAVSSPFLQVLENLHIALFAIDEAHCVSQWGHDFRPEYRDLARVRSHFPHTPTLALTATADSPTRRDIIQNLNLQTAKVFIAGFDRPNISYTVTVKDQEIRQLLHFIQTKHPLDAGIVYAQTRLRVEKLAHTLQSLGLKALPYHAGLDPMIRTEHQNRFLNEEGLIIVATVAFGMGIDKPNVRFVCHVDMPKSLEAYYQETGRAGRDGLEADAWMAYGLADVVKLRQRILASDLPAPSSHRRVEEHKLQAMLGYCETTTCRRKVLLSYFGDEASDYCGHCDTCLDPPATWDATTEAQKLMSTIYRTGQSFGSHHVIDVLTGKSTQKITRLGHESLSTYGIGREHSRLHWRSVLRQLLAKGYVSVDPERHGALTLSPEARSLLRGEHTLTLRCDTVALSAGGLTSPPDHPEEKGALLHPQDQELFESLRTVRLGLARDQGVPPFMIFHDTTLKDMAGKRPQTMEAMRGISGVGAYKLAHYGQVFVQAIQQHRVQQAPTPIPSPL